MTKRTAAGGLALAVCLAAGGACLGVTTAVTTGVALAGAARADSGFAFNTAIAGHTRYDTAIAAAERAFPSGSSSVVLVNAKSTVDGLTASYIAGLHSAPILFTDATSTPVSTSAEMVRLGVTTVYVVGGTNVVSQGQIDDWRASGLAVTSYGGTDRYATAAKAADAGGFRGAGTTVFVASGDEAHLADALAVGPIAYHSHDPILLSKDDDATAPTISEFNRLGATAVFVGGNDVVDDAVMDSFGATVRLAGTNRSLTAAAVADWSIANAGFRKTGVALVGAANANAPDALVAAPVAGTSLIPVLFAGTPDTDQYLRNHTADLSGRGEVFGDTTAVSSSAIAAATTAATSRQQQFMVSGGGGYVTAAAASSSGSSPAISTPAASGNVSYTVSGPPGAKLTVALFNGAKVTTDSLRNVLLARANRNAAPGSVTATIASTNGTPVTAPNSTAATAATTTAATTTAATDTTTAVTSASLTVPASGTGTFVVHRAALVGAGYDTVVPVVYQDTNGDAFLDVGTETATTGRPTEPFGVGRATTFLAAEATTGAIASSAVDLVDKGAGFFTTTAGKLYTFSAADAYAFTANPVGITTPGYADVAARIGAGDLVTGTYAPLSGSSFTLNDTDRAAPVVTAAAVTNTSTVHLSFPRLSGPASYVVYRHIGAPAAFTTAGYTKIATLSNPASGSVTYDDPVGMLAGTNVHYVVTSVVGGLEGAPATTTSDATLLAPAVSSGSPTSTATALTDAGTAGVIDAGDSFTITYSAPLAAPATGSTLRLTDADGTVADLVNGTNATFTVSGSVLTVTVTAAPLVTTAGTTPTLARPATVAAFANASGITAIGGAPWDVATSASANPLFVTIG